MMAYTTIYNTIICIMKTWNAGKIINQKLMRSLKWNARMVMLRQKFGKLQEKEKEDRKTKNIEERKKKKY